MQRQRSRRHDKETDVPLALLRSNAVSCARATKLDNSQVTRRFATSCERRECSISRVASSSWQVCLGCRRIAPTIFRPDVDNVMNSAPWKASAVQLSDCGANNGDFVSSQPPRNRPDSRSPVIQPRGRIVLARRHETPLYALVGTVEGTTVQARSKGQRSL